MKQRRGIRRIVIRASIFLLLGAIVNIAMAWGSAMIVDPSSVVGPYSGRFTLWLPSQYRAGGRWGVGSQFPYSHHAWMIQEWTIRTATRIRSQWYDPDVMIDLGGYWPGAAPEPIVPDWASFMAPPTSPTSGQQHIRVLDVRGWPMRSMWSLAMYDGPVTNQHTWSIVNGIQPPEYTGLRNTTYWSPGRVLPRGIRWLGFIVNSIVYAVAAWMVCSVPAVIRRLRRVPPGCCRACGYDLRGNPETNVCTECGKPVKSRVVGPASSSTASKV